MNKIYAVVNQKGGVGKTTTSVNLAASLAATKRRVLVVDLDAQGNATMGLGVDKNAVELTGFDVFAGEATMEETIQPGSERVDVLPANGDMTAADVALRGRANAQKVLRELLTPLRDRYQVILIDCPPALSMLTVNALVAADGVLIPMQCEYYALEGLSALTDTISKIRQSLNPQLEIAGILRTMYDPRSNLTRQVSAELTQHFGDRVLRTLIPRNIRLAEAPSHGMPAITYDPKSSGAQSYLALAGELIRREGG